MLFVIKGNIESRTTACTDFNNFRKDSLNLDKKL